MVAVLHSFGLICISQSLCSVLTLDPRFEWFPEYLEKSKALCRALHNKNYKAGFVNAAEGLELAEHATTLNRFSGSFAKWRFGTLAHASQSIATVTHAFLAVWRPGMFSMETELQQALNAVVQHPTFWKYNRVVAFISHEIEVLRGWFRGCPCHETECKEFHRQGKLFQCPNMAKSKKGPLVQDKVHELSQRWVNIGSHIDAGEFEGVEFYTLAVPALGDAVGLL